MAFLIVGAFYINDNWDQIQSTINKALYDTEYSSDVNDNFDETRRYREVKVDTCDIHSIPEPNTKANISSDGSLPYFSYTDGLGRVIRVEAEQLQTKKRSGRLCDNMFPSNQNEKAKNAIGYITGSDDNRGHLIADRFDGVSNAYNITAQHEIANQKEYNKLEQDLANFINNGYKVEDFIINVKYESIIDRRPSYYDIYFKVNNRVYQYRLYNDDRPIERK